MRIFKNLVDYFPQQSSYLAPLPHGHGSFGFGLLAFDLQEVTLLTSLTSSYYKYIILLVGQTYSS